MYSQEQQSGANKQASNARAAAVHGSRVIPVIATARRAGLWAMSSGPGSPSAPMTLPPDVFAALVQGQMNPTSMAPQQMNANVFSNTASQPATPMGFGGQAAHMGQGGLEQGHAPQPISQRLHECYPEPWSTGVKHLDQWLQQNMTDEAVFDQLAQLPRTERKQLVGATVSRQGNILNPTKYILGGLKKKPASPMGALGGQAPSADMAHGLRGVARPLRNEAGGGDCRTWANAYSVPGVAGVAPQQAVPQQTGMHNFSHGQQLMPQQTGMHNFSHGQQLIQSAGPDVTEAEPPEWVRDAMVDVTKPSAFVGKLKAQLPPAQQTIIASLPCASQHRLCFALVLVRSSWTDPGSAMEMLLRTYGQLLPEQGIGSQLAAVKKELRMVVLHCCSGIGTSHIVMQGAMRILATARPDVQCNVVESYSFEVDQDALSVESGLIKEMGLACSQLGSIDQLPLLVQQNGPRWLQMNVLVAFLNSWPCKNTSKAAAMKERPEGAGLHMQHSRKMWDIDHAMFLLFNMGMATNKVAHFTEYPQCGNTGEEDTVNKLFGKAFVSNPSSYRAANRARNIRTSPTKLTVKKYHHVIDPSAPLGPWKWCGNGGSEEKYPLVTLRSFIIALIEARLFDSRELEPWEDSTLKRCMMEHVETKETAYISRAFWLLWLGFDKTPVTGIADKLMPCFVNMETATGSIQMPGSSGSGTCGKERYCSNCERLMQLLGQAWHVQSMTDVAVAWLDRIAAAHCSGDASVQWHERPKESPHVCGPMCAQNPVQGF